MKEININIEGYNVNGICVGCLNYNRKMYYKNDVKECFQLLGDIDVPDGLVIQVCWECLAAVRAVKRFQEQILKSYDILIKYSNEHTFLNSPKDLSKHATTKLSTSICEFETIVNIKNEELDDHDVELKKELNLFLNFEVDPKPEPEITMEDPQFVEDLNNDTSIFPFEDNEGSSDEDMLLSKLTKKKDKKSKKAKSKKEKKRKGDKTKEKEQQLSRKLKNLPEDQVEIYTMTEEEMWQVRADDVENKDFVKIKYKCTDCVLAFNSDRLMTYHISAKHNEKTQHCHKCDVCKAFFITKDNLSVHRSLHLSAFKCKECGFRTSLKRLMLNHASTHRTDNNVQYKCKTCFDKFSTKSKLAYHRGVCHQERPQCDCCGKVFANKMTLKYHLKVLPRNKDEKPKERQYIPCKGCSKVFFSKKSYRSHVVIHKGHTYPCPICGKLFLWKRNLARHTRNHRERDAGALHECRECNKTFASRDCYNNHMRLSKRHVAEDGYAHECNYCGKKFPTKWCLVDHIDWDHLKRIKYQCSVCFKPFKTAKIMVAHVANIHEGKKPEPEGEHLCEICGKSYKTVKRLKGHVWAMHTKRSTSKMFKCKLCPATFTWQTSIYKHMKMMHDNNKRSKQTRAPPQVKKQDTYPGIELANRMQYFQQNISNNLVQNIVQTVHVQSIGAVQNIS